jgi:hypothetical protein
MKQKATPDDIGAICSRIDAQTVVMIELLADLYSIDPKHTSAKYRKRYDKLAERFRDDIVGEEEE